MTDVFISYSQKDRKRAERIADRLSKLGFDVWYDAALQAGETYDVRIEEALRSASAVLVLWSPNSVQSEWVRNEASLGKEQDKLVTALLEPAELPVNFRTTHYEILFDPAFADNDSAWLGLIDRIKALSAREHDITKKQMRLRHSRKLRTSFAWLFGYVTVSLLGIQALLAVYYSDVRPAPIRFDVDEGRAFVTASLHPEGGWRERLRFGENSIRIRCIAAEEKCFEAVARIDLQGRFPTLSSQLIMKDIEVWDAERIVAVEENACYRSRLVIDRETDTVYTAEWDSTDCTGEFDAEPRRYTIDDASEDAPLLPYIVGAFVLAWLGWTVWAVRRWLKAIRSPV